VLIAAAAGHSAAGSSTGLSNAGDIAAIVGAAVAVLLLVWGVGDWLLRRARARRALRPPRQVFGKLDHQPEYIRANADYLAAQEHIRGAVTTFSTALTKHQPFATQEQANEAGAAAQALCDAFNEHLPTMSEKGAIARQCLKGILKHSSITHDGDATAGVAMRGLIRDGRVATFGYSRSMKGAKRGLTTLRKRDIALALNEPVEQLRDHLKAGRRLADRMGWGMRRAEWQLTRRLLWYRLRRSVKPDALMRREAKH
jgi:hypothetical protein